MAIDAIDSDVLRWGVPPREVILGANEVHVWRASVDEFLPQLNGFFLTLAAEEQTRAARFQFQRDREHFIVAHGLLREILCTYLSRSPQCLAFWYRSHGKPALARESGEDTIFFNMAHSYGVVIYAVARAREVGIDLEFIRRGLEVEQIADRFFSPGEVAALRALPTEFRENAFFTCWARKEAYIKARGGGLSLPLDQFQVSLNPGEPAALLTAETPGEARRWSLQDLPPVPGYATALAVEGRSLSLSCRHWTRGLELIE